MDKQKLFDFYKENQGGINGALTGLFCAVFILLIGFLKTFFIAICIGIGYYIGKKVTEDKDYIKNLLDRILPPGTYR
jgi:Small integral membrane protein